MVSRNRYIPFTVRHRSARERVHSGSSLTAGLLTILTLLFLFFPAVLHAKEQEKQIARGNELLPRAAFLSNFPC